MTDYQGLGREIGTELANRLGLPLTRRGKELNGQCIACKSSDAFYMSAQEGVAHCFSCDGGWSAYDVAKNVLKDAELAKQMMVELGVFQSRGDHHQGHADPVALVALQKHVPRESLIVYGASEVSHRTIELPEYGPDGKQCTTFRISTSGSERERKGLNAKGKLAGLFFPHVDGKVQLPQRGETWLLVEGPKDAAALHSLGYLACGLNTKSMAPKFARLFRGVNVIVVPDRDDAGEKGAQQTAAALHRVATSVRIAQLPTEYRQSKGDDVRDVLRKKDGEQLVRQAIADAEIVDYTSEADNQLTFTIELPEREPLQITVSQVASNSRPQRVVTAECGNVTHTDNIDVNSQVSRNRFARKLAEKLELEMELIIGLVETQLVDTASDVDRQFGCRNHGGQKQESHATIAVGLVEDWELWHTPAGDAFVTYDLGGHRETWPISARCVARYLGKLFYESQGTTIGSDALKSAMELLAARAIHDGGVHDVYLRVAEHDGNIYVDLCNDAWQVVEVTRDGWTVLDASPVHFRRSNGMLPLPIPERGGSINQLRSFLNVDDTTWQMSVAWILAAYRPRGPYPVLALFAEQGSGKSSAGRLLRSLVDPNAAPLRSENRDPRELMITAHNSWCLAYDNISHVPQWLSDALCRLSTGGGFAARELYTDTDEIIFHSTRPMLITSIDDVAKRSDLLDRCLVVLLPAIPEVHRRPESQMNSDFERVHAGILGAILDVVSTALHRVDEVQLPKLPRMADFAIWVTAAEPGLGWAPGTFMESYTMNRNNATEIAIDANVIGRPLLRLLNAHGQWEGCASELLTALNHLPDHQLPRPKDWPTNARVLATHLNRLAPNLRQLGWFVDNARTSHSRAWRIVRNDAKHKDQDFASHVCVTHPTGKSMQTDATECQQSVDDANDANDGRLHTPDPGRTDHNSAVEKGEL